MAFPAYTMLSAHQMMETYVGEGAFQGHQVGSVKLMQLFQAFPAQLCEDALSPAVLDALTSIQDAKTAQRELAAQQALRASDGDRLGSRRSSADLDEDESAAEEKEQRHEATETALTAASSADDTDLITQLKKHTFTELSATRFYAYSIMNDEQIQAMDAFNVHLEAPIEKSAYIHRFELSVSESCLTFSQLGKTLQECNAGEPAVPSFPMSSSDSLPRLRNRIGGKYSASESGNGVGGGGGGGGGGVLGGSSRRNKSDGGGDNLSALPPPEAVDAAAAEIAKKVSETTTMNVFSVSPVNLALHRSSSCCTPIQVGLEVSFEDFFLLFTLFDG